jgi:hypothetical protein
MIGRVALLVKLSMEAKAGMLSPLLRQYRGAILIVCASLLLALAMDWLVAPWPYPVVAVYGIALLIAWRLPPRGVAITGWSRSH